MPFLALVTALAFAVCGSMLAYLSWAAKTSRKGGSVWATWLGALLTIGVWAQCVGVLWSRSSRSASVAFVAVGFGALAFSLSFVLTWALLRRRS